MNVLITLNMLASITTLKFNFAYSGGYTDQRDIESCINIIYGEFSIPRPVPIENSETVALQLQSLYPQNLVAQIQQETQPIDKTKHMKDLTKKLLSSMMYTYLISSDAKEYFMYIHDLLSPLLTVSPITENSVPVTIMNPIQYCQIMAQAISDQIALVELEEKNCKRQLFRYYRDSTDSAFVLKDAFKNSIIDDIEKTGNYAYGYHLLLESAVDFSMSNDAVKTPEDWCNGLTSKTNLVNMEISKKRRFDSPGASTSGTKRYSARTRWGD